jgi:hypothetical protein
VKKFGFATIIAGGLATAVLGLAAPAQASVATTVENIAVTAPQGIDHLDWLNDIKQKVNVARPDTSVRSHP